MIRPVYIRPVGIKPITFKGQNEAPTLASATSPSDDTTIQLPKLKEMLGIKQEDVFRANSDTNGKERVSKISTNNGEYITVKGNWFIEIETPTLTHRTNSLSRHISTKVPIPGDKTTQEAIKTAVKKVCKHIHKLCDAKLPQKHWLSFLFRK